MNGQIQSIIITVQRYWPGFLAKGVERGRAVCDKWRVINQLPHNRSAAS